MRCSLLILALAALLTAGGCGESLQVRTYNVAKPTSKDRMLAAMVSLDDRAWFFKLTGRYRSVTENVERFWEFVKTVEFSDDTKEPIWDLPEGWKEQPARLGSMRYSTLIMPTKDLPLELAVLMLPIPRGAGSIDFQLANINRWRRQMGKPPLDAESLADGTTRLEVGPLNALGVDLSGEFSDGQSGMRPGAMAGRSPASVPPAGAPQRPANPAFEKPESWKTAPLKTFSIATFDIPDSDAWVSISPVRGGLLANVSRWRGQLGLPPMSPAEVEDALTEGPGGMQLLVLAADAEPQDKVTVIATKQHEGTDWYVRFSGTNQTWKQQEASFRQLLQSMEF